MQSWSLQDDARRSSRWLFAGRQEEGRVDAEADRVAHTIQLKDCMLHLLKALAAQAVEVLRLKAYHVGRSESSQTTEAKSTALHGRYKSIGRGAKNSQMTQIWKSPQLLPKRSERVLQL